MEIIKEENKIDRVFIHRSIKTRIETYRNEYRTIFHNGFLYIDPLKQGLKQKLNEAEKAEIDGFYT